MSNVFALDKWARLRRIMRQHGSLRKFLYNFWRMDTAKEGKLMGVDTFGNKYYQNDYYQFPRNRWVDYNMDVRWNYDGSMVTAEWYGWLHHKTDRVPCEDPAKIELFTNPYTKRWLMPHEENLSGTTAQYYPYSTTPPRMSPWDGSTVACRCCWCKC